MKDLYFDIIGGISGDMTVAALLDLGVDLGFLRRELAKIGVAGYKIKTSIVARGHAQALKFDVVITKPKNYSYRQIVRLIRTSGLLPGVRKNILKVYEALMFAETKVHGHRHNDVSFHQLGDIDSIVDIAGACICLDKLGVVRILYSAVPLSNKIAPATLELLKDKNVYFTGLLYENVTPTGAAILAALGGPMEAGLQETYMIKRAGCGAGACDPVEIPNCLRAIELERGGAPFETDETFVIESNIDDMNPQFFDYLFERLFEAGAYDAFIENVIMKKTRPGFLLTALSNRENLDKITRIVLEETTTLGVRFYPANRLKCVRKIETIDLGGHKARVKLAYLPHSVVKAAPEYEDCKALAKKTRQPISKVYSRIKQKAELKWRSQV